MTLLFGLYSMYHGVIVLLQMRYKYILKYY